MGTKMSNGIRVELTAEEQTAHDAAQAAAQADEEARAIVTAQIATDKASAKAKLIAGEALTEAEADTIVI